MKVRHTVTRLSARPKLQKLFIVCLILCLFVVILRRYLEENVPRYGSSSGAISIRKEREVKTVLVWSHPWGHLDEGVKDGSQVDNCYFTYDRNAIQDASAVVFHYTALDEEYMPWRHYRDSDQFFVFYSMESPSHALHAEGRDFAKFDNGFINWTMTYRLDSDIYYPYIRFNHQMLPEAQGRLDRVLPQKKEVALWVVSNCGMTKGAKDRMKYVDELVKAGLPVHRYGKCFNNKMEIDSMSRERRDQFKFYLAFESSYHCKDYITENFWGNAVASSMVPVVWGPTRKDLEKVAPTGSFIHADDFESPKALAAYLLRLHKDDREYRKYFDWLRKPECRTRMLIENFRNSRERALCNKLNHDARPKVLLSVTEFVYGTEFKECLH